MAIQITCAGCKKKFAVKDELAGKRLRCPACKGVIEVPEITISMPAPTPSQRRSTVRNPIHTQANSARKLTDSDTVIGSVKSSVRTSAETQGSALCPSCGKSMPANLSTCPHCKHNIKLGRKLQLNAAIADASREPGVRADGTRYVTRAERATIREQEGFKIRKIMIITAVTILVIGGIIFAWRALSVLVTPGIGPLAEKAGIGPLTENPSSFHPYRIGSTLSEITIPLEQLSVESVASAAEPKDEAGGFISDPVSAWVEANRLPYVHLGDDQLYGSSAETVIAVASNINSQFSPEKVKEKNLPSKMLIWRLRPSLDQQGSLTGALLDVGKQSNDLLDQINTAYATLQKMKADRQAYIESEVQRAKDNEELTPEPGSSDSPELLEKALRMKLEKVTQSRMTMPLLKLSGVRLTFLYCHKKALRGGSGSYSESLQADADRIRLPDQPTAAKEAPKGAPVIYFIPVLTTAQTPEMIYPGAER